MSLQLREVTKHTVREVCALEVRDEQKGYVATNALSIAQAHFEPDTVFRAVCLGERPIGFVQWRAAETPGTVVLWRFMIDRAYQAAGHGSAALALALQEMRSSGFKTIEASVVPGSASPLAFYLRHGFEETDQTTLRGEWLLRRPL
ncbi:MAG: GNAT family N-acetyltransferase [Methylocystis sp.]|nr:GNAT family N-acetyltransferase [Methylocystis sp.]MCA3584942.1 GNAT family N-acetyltransferase [Methylocystis sp.]MCA3589856.1 GNAT family N-acetyltransferase [Methylocystis sp.]MCA3593481.1 GNAT family N-acetyltransferase [Methylocystis sp.]